MSTRHALFFVALLPFIAHAQGIASRAGAHVPSGSYAAIASSSGEPQEARIELDRHIVGRGETLETILVSRGVRYVPRAAGLVLEANPEVRDVNWIREGTTLYIPHVPDWTLDSPVVIGSPEPVQQAQKVSVALSQQALVIESTEVQQAFQRYAQTLERSTSPFVGVPARTLDTWSAQGEALAELAARADGAELAAELASEAADGLEKTIAYSSQGRSPLIPITVLARDPPNGRIPSSCRIRYALWGYAYEGHEVRSDRVMDFSASACDQGRQVLDAWASYGVWAEWSEDEVWYRSQIKKVAVDPDMTWAIDLPLQPFETSR